MFFYRGTKNRASLLTHFKKWSEDKNSLSCYDGPPATIWSLHLQQALVIARWGGIQDSHQACAILLRPEPLVLPKTLRYNIRLDSLFFDVTIKGDLGPIGLRWKPRACAVSVLTVVRPMCSLWQWKQRNVTLWGCSFPVLSVCTWLNFWGSLTSLPINPGFMRQTGNPKNLDLEVPSQTASPPSFRSFYACFFLLVLSKYNVQCL